jgi:hypothetical protein
MNLQNSASCSDQQLWHEDHKECGGEYQSPIEIDRDRATPRALTVVETVGYHGPLPGLLNLTNNGHSGTAHYTHTSNIPNTTSMPTKILVLWSVILNHNKTISSIQE